MNPALTKKSGIIFRSNSNPVLVGLRGKGPLPKEFLVKRPPAESFLIVVERNDVVKTYDIDSIDNLHK